MKKLLSILLTFVMAVCLINLNSNHTKAEDENDKIVLKTGADINNIILKNVCSNNQNNLKHIVFQKGDHTGLTTPRAIDVGGTGTANAGLDAATSTVYIYGATDGYSFNSNSGNMFGGFEKLESIDFGNGVIDTSNVADMSNMFKGCGGLSSLDLSDFNTSSVTKMNDTFMSCGKLTSLDLSGFDTSNVTTMKQMFRGCSQLSSLDLSGFDTSSVKDMESMFRGCGELSSLDLSDFNTSNVTTMSNIFDGCSKLTSLDLSGFDTSEVKYMDFMFNDCKALTNIDMSSFDTSKVIVMSKMFRNCYSLTSIDIHNFNTSAVQYMTNVFQMEDTNQLTTIKVGDGWSTSAVTSSGEMFSGCTNLVGSKGTAYDPSHVDATYARIDGGVNSPGYFGEYVEPKPGPKPTPSPEPQPKDESCEKVIGPTWHWNNDKGICEDYGVVGTSTR